jgi:hypothetical protein
MPVGKGPGVVVTPEVTPGRVLPRPFQAGPYVPTWITPADRSGVVREIPLNPPGPAFFSLKNIAGLGVAPIDIATSANPDGGSTIDAIRPTSRQIVWPFRIRGNTNPEFLATWRRMGQYLAMTRRFGPGKLRLTREDGTAREIAAYYQSGWEGEPGDGAWLEDTCTVSLLCPDPFWRDVTPTIIERETGTLVDYLDPYPNIGSGQVLSEPTVLVNPGQADVWPEWTITGPMTSLTAVNNTRNQSFVLTYDLDDGEVITMSSRPIQIRGPGDTNLISALNLPAGKPWRLDAEWASDVEFTVAGAGAGTKVSLRFHPGYETA